MMKRLFAILTAAALLFTLLPASAFAAAKQMNDDVPVWTEETVRQYALDYIEGISMSRLWGYYDLQIRRYMPMETFQALLTDLEWMTGAFIELGSYRSFEDSENQLKTHVLHLCMEKQDLDLYFTHKNKEDDWEIMAIEFVPAEDEAISDGSDMLVGGRDAGSGKLSYTETNVTIGSYQLEGVLTMPNKASADAPVPACVLVHDFGPLDRNSTIGQTALFSDLAKALADMGIATLRYDKRTYVYGEDAASSVWEETVEDALFAVGELTKNKLVDQKRIVLIGHGLGAMLAPRIVSQSEGAFTAMILIAGVPDSLLSYEAKRASGLSDEEMDNVQNAVKKLASMKETEARELTLLGRNGYYYWETEPYDSVSLMKQLRVPTYVVQGKQDPVVSEDDGWRAYAEQLGDNQTYMSFKSFRGLNHLLMNDLSTNAQGQPEYAVETHLDTQAGRNIAQWILNLYQTTDD